MTIFLIIAASVGWTLCVLLGFLLGAAIAQIPDVEVTEELPDNVYEFKDGSFVTWGGDDA